MHRWWVGLVALGVLGLAACTPDDIPQAFNPDAPPLVPLPTVMEPGQGQFVLDVQTQVSVAAGNADAQAVAAQFVDMLAETSGVTLAQSEADAGIVFALDQGQGIPSEGYVLDVDETTIRITASDRAGLFYGASSLWQLLARVDAFPVAVPSLRILDAPRFAWRGSHRDVSRHMFSMEHLKRHLDLMARYKFNIFHWHLTDDQGWRLEIKRYPKLTEISAWRAQTAIHHHRDGRIEYDGTPYGGFYTQDEAREIVEYARQRNITVVPEFDMPGHVVAVLAAYPELACTPGPFAAWVDWGVSDDIFCPSEDTFTFVEGVLDEMMEIFPSEYIHAGGDEAPTIRWEQSPLAQDIIRREGLKDEHALQAWFMRRVERHINQHGRRLLAWDEILDGDPEQSTTIMSWRGIGPGIAAAKRGHDVVMTPVTHSYFDYCQSRAADEPSCPGFLPLPQVYAFEPVPPQLNADEAKHILGGQANLWVEHIRTEEHAEFMLWPRLLAMSEALWSQPERRSFEDFMTRVPAQLNILGRLGVNYRIPDVIGLDGDVHLLGTEASVTLHSSLEDAAIVYTLDGSDPVAGSTRYQGPLTLTLGPEPITVSARLLTADGRLGPMMRANYGQIVLQPARQASATQTGVQRDYFEVSVLQTDQLLGASPLRSDVVDAVGLPDFARHEQFGLRYRGALQIPADGAYRFALGSDDGARLLIDDAVLIDRDGPQSPGTSYGNIGLAAGEHAFELRYFQGGGDRVLELNVSVDGGADMPVPAEWFTH